MHKTFEDIKAWQLGRKFRKEIYDMTKKFPEEEMYILTPQIRRATISITANYIFIFLNLWTRKKNFKLNMRK